MVFTNPSVNQEPVQKNRIEFKTKTIAAIVYIEPQV